MNVIGYRQRRDELIICSCGVNVYTSLPERTCAELHVFKKTVSIMILLAYFLKAVEYCSAEINKMVTVFIYECKSKPGSVSVGNFSATLYFYCTKIQKDLFTCLHLF